MKLVDLFWTPIGWLILKVMDFGDWFETLPEKTQLIIGFNVVVLCIIGVGLIDGSIPPEHFRYY